MKILVTAYTGAMTALICWLMGAEFERSMDSGIALFMIHVVMLFVWHYPGWPRK